MRAICCRPAWPTHSGGVVNLAGQPARTSARPTSPSRCHHVPCQAQHHGQEDRIAAPLARVRVARPDIEAFVGSWLTEPKAHVSFTRPSRQPAARAFRQAAGRRGVRLDLGTLALYDAGRMYVNGEILAPDPAARAQLRRLLDRRALAPREASALSPATLAVLRDWHRHGWLHLGS